MSRREINIKPTCLGEINALPADEAPAVWEKINFLVENPLPDGKVKKKLAAQADLYRLRAGDYRVFYTFGDGWVRLLGVRRRQTHTYDNLGRLAPDRPAAPASGGEVDLDDLPDDEAPPQGRPAFRFEAGAAELTPLPHPLTAEWLTGLKVPPGLFPVLIPCRTEEELLAAAVPPAVLSRVVDSLFPPPLEEVARQPDLVVPDAQDLVRYRQGDLLAFLLKLDPDQQELADWALEGPTMVKGGAGTGKSTVALYRVKALLERPGATGKERLLFTTFTQALIAASRQLLGQLLTPAQRNRVRVATCDEVAREVVAGGRAVGRLASTDELLTALRQARAGYAPAGGSAFDRKAREAALAKLSDRYLLDEFEWIIDGRGLTTAAEYLEAARPGRGQVLRAGARQSVWEIYERYTEGLRQRNRERFTALRLEAAGRVRSGAFADLYDFVVVDESQDLSPAALGLLAELARRPEGLFLAADGKQSLYSRSHTWASAHPRLQFTGRTRVLTRNYRTTAQIDRAAFAVLEPEEGEALAPSDSVHEGPIPLLLRGARPEQEGEWAARFIRQMCRHLHLGLHAAAVLAPTREAGARLAEALAAAGVAARYFPGNELDLKADCVKVLTLHSAKGLEFPVVVVAGYDPAGGPRRENYADEGVYRERMRNERRLLYVGLTRAMRGLMLSVPAGCTHEALTALAPDQWSVEEVG